MHIAVMNQCLSTDFFNPLSIPLAQGPGILACINASALGVDDVIQSPEIMSLAKIRHAPHVAIIISSVFKQR